MQSNEKPPADALHSNLPKASTAKVLVVDDQIAWHKKVSTILLEMNVATRRRIEFATDADTALEAPSDRSSYDLVILDRSFQYQRGDEVPDENASIKFLRNSGNSPALASAKVIMHSGESLSDVGPNGEINEDYQRLLDAAQRGGIQVIGAMKKGMEDREKLLALLSSVLSFDEDVPEPSI